MGIGKQPRALLLALAGFLWLGPFPLAPLQAQDWEGRPVVEVRHQPEEPGEPALDSASLEAILSQKTGQPYSARKVQESLRSLYATGRFSDIRVEAQPEGGGVVLTFRTRASYFIGFVAVRGVRAPPTEGRLHAATELQLGQRFLEEDVPGAIERLRRTLEDDGYFQVEIAPQLHYHPESQQVDIEFDVKTGERARLGEVRVTGDPGFSAERLVRQAKWKSGKPLTSEYVLNGLARMRSLYRDENFLEAQVRVAAKPFREETNEVDLELEANRGTPVEVSVTGASIGRSRLTRLLPIFEVGALDEDLLREGERNLRDYFESEGYFDVTVQALRQTAAGKVAVEYQVNLGRRQRLAAVEIQGNRYFGTEVLRERMRIEPASLTSRRGRFSSTLLEQDVASIRSLYQSNGFLQVQITSSLRRRGPESENEIVAGIEIQEGPQQLVGDFSITGNQSFSRERLESVINAGSGQPYSASLANSDRNNLLTFYFNEGFRDTRFEWRATPAGPEETDLEYILDEGRREFVRHIYVDGLEKTRRGVVNRQLQLQEGEPLSQGKLLETQRRLYNLGIFNQVEIAIQDPRSGQADRNVLLHVEEARRYTVNVGLGVETGRFGESSEGVEGKNRVSPNVTLDVTRLNVGGRPHTAGLRTRFSTIEKRAGLSYTAPRFLNYEWLNASARAFLEETRDVQTFTARRIEGSLQFESKRSRATTLLHRYTFRRVTIPSGTLKISPDQVPLLSRPVIVGLLSQTWIRDTRDFPGNARQGMFNTADTGVATQAFGSRESFARLLLQNSSYHRLGKNLVLARSVQFGVQAPFHRGEQIPIAERFFSGGGNSHRGFAINQAGPRDLVTGFAVGGNALLLNNTELRFPVWRESLAGALFHDAGNVFARLRDFSLRQHQRDLSDFAYIAHAVGLGVRYHTPIGPVRLDLGYALNPARLLVQTEGTTRAETLSRWQIFFSVGQSF